VEIPKRRFGGAVMAETQKTWTGRDLGEHSLWGKHVSDREDRSSVQKTFSFNHELRLLAIGVHERAFMQLPSESEREPPIEKKAGNATRVGRGGPRDKTVGA